MRKIRVHVSLEYVIQRTQKSLEARSVKAHYLEVFLGACLDTCCSWDVLEERDLTEVIAWLVDFDLSG